MNLTIYKYVTVEDEEVKEVISSYYLPGDTEFNNTIRDSSNVIYISNKINYEGSYITDTESTNNEINIQTIVDPTANKTLSDIYQISLNTYNLYNLFDTMFDFYNNYSDYYFSIETGNIKLVDAKILDCKITDANIAINFISKKPVISSNIITENILHTICGNINIPDVIKFYKYGNVIVIESNEIELTNDSLDVDNILVECDDAIKIEKYNEFIKIYFEPITKYKLLNIRLGKINTYIYTNLPEPTTDIILQKLDMLTYKCAFGVNSESKDLVQYFEVYKVDDNNNETLYTSSIGNNSTISLEPNDNSIYRIYSILQNSPMDLKIKKYTELYATTDRTILQFLTDTTIEKNEYISIYVYDDIILEISGYNAYKLSKNTQHNIEFNKSGIFTANIFSVQLNKYVGKFIINVLDDINDNTFFDIIFDDIPIYGRNNIMRIKSIEQNIDNLLFDGDISIIDKLDDSTYVVKFNKPGFCNILVSYETGEFITSKYVNVEYGNYDFDIDITTDGFSITAPYDMILTYENMVLFLKQHERRFIEVYTTGKYEISLILYNGENEFENKLILESTCNNCDLINTVNDEISFVTPPNIDVTFIKWYINDSFYKSMINYINVPLKYNNVVDVRVEYFINNKMYQLEKRFNLNRACEINIQYQVLVNKHDDKLNVTNPVLTMNPHLFDKIPSCKFYYFDRIYEVKLNKFYKTKSGFSPKEKTDVLFIK